MYSIYLWTVLAPLIGAIVAGLFGRVIGRAGAHWVTIIAVAIATVLSFLAFKHVVWDGAPGFNGTVYVWGVVGDLRLEIGVLIDESNPIRRVGTKQQRPSQQVAVRRADRIRIVKMPAEEKQ